jgi:hypothetical protein
MSYLNKVNLSLVDDRFKSNDEDEDNVEVVEEVVKVVKKPVINKPKVPTKVDTSVSILEGRMRSKLDDIGLNSKLINEVISFVLNDVKSVPNLKLGENTNVARPVYTKPVSVNEFSNVNDVRGAAEFLLEGIPESSGGYTRSYSSDSNAHVSSTTSSVADRASSLL